MDKINILHHAQIKCTHNSIHFNMLYFVHRQLLYEMFTKGSLAGPKVGPVSMWFYFGCDPD